MNISSGIDRRPAAALTRCGLTRARRQAVLLFAFAGVDRAFVFLDNRPQ
jgi:hypothetical protein